jgi:HEAT repeat protein
MPAARIATHLATLRAKFDAGTAAEKCSVVSELWGLCLEQGVMARAALPWLRELVESRDDDTVGKATHALGRAGKAGLAELRALLEHPREVVRRNAAYGLGQAGDPSPATLTALAGMLKAASPGERIAALKALADIVEITERTRLLAALQKDLLAALEDPDPAVASWVPDALKGAGLPPKRFIEIALYRLDPRTGAPRYEMVGTLAELLSQVDPRPYLPALLRILERTPQLVSRFVPVFARMGPEAAVMVPKLEPLAKGDADDALIAGGALLRIAGRGDVLKKLARRLPSSPDEIAGIICGIGPAAAPLAGTLARVIDDRFDEPDWDLMWALTDALAAIESPEAVAVKALRKALRHKSGRVQGCALRGLERLGPAARAALPDLRKLLGKSTGPSRKLVRETIDAIAKATN